LGRAMGHREREEPGRFAAKGSNRAKEVIFGDINDSLSVQPEKKFSEIQGGWQFVNFIDKRRLYRGSAAASALPGRKVGRTA